MKSFVELIRSEQLTLVDFFADWCGPCETQASVLSELSGDYSGRVKILKVDIEKNPGAARQYDVRSIPTLLLFQKGEILWRHIGLTSFNELKQVLDYHVRPKMAV